MMGKSVTLLCLSIPFVLGRLGHQSSEGNQTFFATNEVPMFQSSEQNLVFDINDLDLVTVNHPDDDFFDENAPPFDIAEFENEALSFDLMSPDELVVLDEDQEETFNESNITMAARDARRELQSGAMSVTIRNDCSLKAFWLAIIYYSTSQGKLVHKGWYNLRTGHRVTFTDVGKRKYSLYAMSQDRRFIWQGNSASARHCPNNRCYKDFSVGGTSTNHFRYLSCSSSGSNPPPPPPPPAPSPSVSGRPLLWVQAHNTRRQRLHGELGVTYNPLQWSNKLAVSAQGYANRLASITWADCHIQHGYQGDSYGGENIASNWGDSSFQFETPDAVLTRWFEKEKNLPWPQNGHYTQVGWRGTNLVGCGEARKLYGGNKYCKVQVCRYLAPGNCNVGSKSLRSLMADDYSPCGPQN